MMLVIVFEQIFLFFLRKYKQIMQIQKTSLHNAIKQLKYGCSCGCFRYTIKSGDVHSLTIKKVSLADDKAKVKVVFGEASSDAELRVVGK